jgi:N-acyl-L-homoserine lactone synthetase
MTNAGGFDRAAPDGIQVRTGRADALPPALRDGMFRLRHQVFRERLRWDVESVNGRERDRYDGLGPVYVLATCAPTTSVVGCCRLLPTTGPYMLPDVFSAALRGSPAPSRPQAWELTRLAVARARHRHGTGLGFGALAGAVLRAAAEAAEGEGADTLVSLSGIGIERKFHADGIATRRLGDRQATRIGNVLCVAYEYSTAQTRHAYPRP